MRKILLVVLFSISFSITKAQVYSLPQYALDTILKHTFRGEVGALFKASFEESDERVDIQLNVAVGTQYISGRHDYRANVDWYYDSGSKPNDSIHKAYILAGVGLFKYKHEGDKMVERRTYFAPIYIFHRNSERGLEWRHQVGIAFQPYAYKSRRLWCSFLVGGVYSYSSWDFAGYGYASLGEKSVALDEQRSKYVREFEPMLMVNFYYRPTEKFNVDFTSYAQFPTVVPHPKAAVELYPELGKLYPHVVFDMSFKYTMFKTLSWQVKLKSDYEKTRPTLYMKGFEWYTMVGLNWKFSTFLK